MTTENIVVLATVAATFIALIIGIVLITRHFAKLENKVDAVRYGVNQTIRQNNGMLNLFATLIGLLGEKSVIDKKDFGTILRDVTQNLRVGEVSPNPISREQAERLNTLIRKAQRGEAFTVEEVEEYSRLVRILEEENPNNPDVWALVALAAILLGLYLVNRNR